MTDQAVNTDAIQAFLQQVALLQQAPKAAAPRKAPKKKPNHKLLWAEHCLLDGKKPWRIEVEKTLSSGAMVYRWNGVFFDAVGPDGGAGLALEHLRKTDREAFDPGLSEKCHKALALSLRMSASHKLPEAANGVIPLTDTYLEITELGAIFARKPDPKYGMTYAIDVRTGLAEGRLYTPKSLPAGSRFRSFLEHAQPNPEVRALLQELCGATLLKNNYSVASWHYGAAGAGKSTLAELCMKMQCNAQTSSLADLSDRFSNEQLIGASFVYVDEADTSGRVAEGKLKTLISQNALSIDRKNEKGISTRVRAKWMFSSNDKPFFRDKSDGLWRRLCIIEWTNPIPEGIREQDFHAILWKEEGNLILDWMIEGAVRLVKRGRFLPEAQWPKEVLLSKEYAREEADSIRAWVNANQVQSVADRAHWKPKFLIYRAYRLWCEDQDIPALEPNVFWRGLRPKLGLSTDYQRSVPGQGSKPHQGVQWTTSVDEIRVALPTIQEAAAAAPPAPPRVLTSIPGTPIADDDAFLLGLKEAHA